MPYALLIYPHATILTEETAQLLEAYVAQGGTLIMGARTGYKDIYGRCPMRPMPGFAAELCGVKVTDYTHLSPGDEAEYALWENDVLEAPVFNDILTPQLGGQVLATFKGNYYSGEPALVTHKIGLGTTYYFGAGFSPQTAQTFLEKLHFAEPYRKLIKLPKEAELAIRSTPDQQYLFVLNYMAYPIEISLQKSMTNLLTHSLVEGTVSLEPYGVLILENK